MAEFKEVMERVERICGRMNGKCIECPFHGKKCDAYTYVKQWEDIVGKFKKEHPIKTNADKFEEVFGFRPKVGNERTRCFSSMCRGTECKSCKYNGFWDKEYKEQKNE